MTIPATCQVARKTEPCSYCHAEPGCDCHGRAPGVHLCRIARAAHDGHLTQLDFVTCIPDGAPAGWTLVLDGAVTS